MRTSDTGTAEQEIVVRCPDAPPDLGTEAARALLGLLRAVAESDARSEPGRDRAA